MKDRLLTAKNASVDVDGPAKVNREMTVPTMMRVEIQAIKIDRIHWLGENEARRKSANSVDFPHILPTNHHAQRIQFRAVVDQRRSSLFDRCLCFCPRGIRLRGGRVGVGVVGRV